MNKTRFVRMLLRNEQRHHNQREIRDGVWRISAFFRRCTAKIAKRMNAETDKSEARRWRYALTHFNSAYHMVSMKVKPREEIFAYEKLIEIAKDELARIKPAVDALAQARKSRIEPKREIASLHTGWCDYQYRVASFISESRRYKREIEELLKKETKGQSNV